MIFSKSLIKNNRSGLAQWNEVQYARNAYAANERMHANALRQAGLRVNKMSRFADCLAD